MDTDDRNVRRFHEDGPFGSFEMHVWQPASASRLRDSVERIWHWDGTTADPREVVYPDVNLELIVQLDHRYRPVRGGRTGNPFPRVNIDGLHHAAHSIAAPSQRCRVLGVRFRPGAAFALLREPLVHLADRTVDVAAILGPAASELVERCGDARDGIAAIAAARAWVEERVAPDAIDDIAFRCARALVACGGAIAVATLADDVGLSPASLTRRFKTHVGTTPKRFARIARFRKTLDALAAGASLADVTYRMHYFDHAHLDAEFRALAGISPSSYRSAAHFQMPEEPAEAAD